MIFGLIVTYLGLKTQEECKQLCNDMSGHLPDANAIRMTKDYIKSNLYFYNAITSNDSNVDAVPNCEYQLKDENKTCNNTCVEKCADASRLKSSNYTSIDSCRHCSGCSIHYGHCKILVGATYDFKAHKWYFDLTGDSIVEKQWKHETSHLPPEFVVYGVRVNRRDTEYYLEWIPTIGNCLDQKSSIRFSLEHLS